VYGPLYERICLDKATGYRRIVLTGTAGIGKSVFLLYLLWRLATSEALEVPPPTVLFELQSDEAAAAFLCFRPGQPVLVGGRGDFLSVLEDKRAWCAPVLPRFLCARGRLMGSAKLATLPVASPLPSGTWSTATDAAAEMKLSVTRENAPFSCWRCRPTSASSRSC